MQRVLSRVLPLSFLPSPPRGSPAFSFYRQKYSSKKQRTFLVQESLPFSPKDGRRGLLTVKLLDALEATPPHEASLSKRRLSTRTPVYLFYRFRDASSVQRRTLTRLCREKRAGFSSSTGVDTQRERTPLLQKRDLQLQGWKKRTYE